MRFTLTIFLLVLSNWPSAGLAQWEPISRESWTVPEDSNAVTRGAEMLFERVHVNDLKLATRQQSNLTLYQRIRIHNARGRKWGNITLPVLTRDQRIKSVVARSIQPNGKIDELTEDHLFEKEAVRSKETRIIQKSFSIPGVTANCIVEFIADYELPFRYPIWLIQKPIPLRRGEFSWVFFRGRGLTDESFNVFRNTYVPNFTWLNLESQSKGQQEVLPSRDDPQEIHFSIENVPAFDEEPYTGPDITRLTQLRHYYSDVATSSEFWKNRSDNIRWDHSDFRKDRREVGKIADSLRTIKDDSEKIRSVFNWVRENIRNISFNADRKTDYKENTTGDEVIARRYGTSADITRLMEMILREMGYHARVIHVISRKRDFLIPEAKLWRFDGALIGVILAGQLSFFAPGYPEAAFTQIPSVYEGIQGFMEESSPSPFVTVPPSSPESNVIHRTVWYQFSDASLVVGKWNVELSGHANDSIGSLLAESSDTERERRAKDYFASDFENGKITAARIKEINSFQDSLRVEGDIEFVNFSQGTGMRRIIQPFYLFRHGDNSFTDVIRRNAILFDYAYTLKETVRIALPSGWTAENLPAPVQFANRIGKCEVTFSSVDDTVFVERLITLQRPYWKPEDYPLIHEYFKVRQSLRTVSLVLRQVER